MKLNQNSIPGLFNPGVRMYAPSGNPNMTNIKSLEEIAAVKPEIMHFLQMWYLEHSDPLIRMVLYLGGYKDLFNGSTSKQTNDMASFESFLSSNVKKIGTNKFRYKIPIAGKQQLFFTRDAEGTRNAAGLYDGEFVVYVSTNEIGLHETIILADQPIPSVLLVKRVSSTGRVLNNGREETKLLVQPAFGSAIKANLVKTNQQFDSGYPISVENSTRGAKPKSEGFGANWVENIITTMRWQTGITGHAHNQNINKQVFEFMSPQGQSFNFWLDYNKHRMNIDKTKAMAKYIMYAKRFTKTGEGYDDETGNLMIAGDGVLAQTNPKLRRPYKNITLDLFEEQTELMLRDDPNFSSLTRKKFMIPVPMSNMLSLSKELVSVFGANPEPLYTTEGTKYKGVDINMNLYRTPQADYYFVGHNTLNSRDQPSLLNEFGEQTSNQSIYMMNMSEYDNGNSNMFLVSNRTPIVNAVYKGMADAKSGEQISHTADSVELHDLASLGVGVPNPNFLSILYKR